MLSALAFHAHWARDIGYARYLKRQARRKIAKWVLRRPSRVVLASGVMVELPHGFACATELYVAWGEVDWGTEELLLRHLEPDGVFLDVGAHLGYYAVMAAERVRLAVAFEPDDRVLPYLRRNARRAGVEVVESAVGDHVGSAAFEPGADPATSRLAPTGAIRVPVTTLDAVVAERDWRVTGVKVDAEGADLRVLAGAEALMRRDQPLVALEFDPSQGIDALLHLAGRVEYGVFAFATTRGAGFATARLRRMDRADLAGLAYKMVFLVPRRLVTAFERSHVASTNSRTNPPPNA